MLRASAGRACCALAVTAALASGAGATAFWLTPSESNGAPGPSTLQQTLCGVPAGAAPQSFFVWATVDAGKTLSNASLNLASSDPSVLDFAGGWWNNTTAGGVPRFQFVHDSSDTGLLPPLVPSTSPTDRLDALQGFSLDATAATGLSLANADDLSGGVPRWLVAEIQWLPVAIGTTEIHLQIGDNGLNNLGEDAAAQIVTLGRDDDVAYQAGLSTHRSVTLPGDSPDAVITLHGVNSDFNGDGVVDGLDLAVWEAAFYLAGGADCRTADGDSDGDADGADLLAWQRAFAPSRPAPATPIPEPASGVLGLMGALAALPRWRNSARS
ncbi:MAG: hypothetical protein KDA44_08225 [Planctomycetales bacterium]|nr:hypothetical protein [Planctomycetales bacterium]